MLSYDERALLHWAARTGAPPDAALIDAGSFLGGSTVSLARGVVARDAGRGTPPVHAYDLFEFSSEWEHQWVPADMEFAVGASSLPVFERTIHGVREQVEVHAGDIRAATWRGDPLSVLFIDIAKAWDTADHIARTFFPWLVPGESLVIQQDQVHWGHPWCAITMELLADHFDFLGWVWFSSAVYRCTQPIAQSELPRSLLDDLGMDEKLALVDRFADRIGWPIGASVRLSGAVVLGAHGQIYRAHSRIAELEAEVNDEQVPYLSEGYAYLKNWLEGVSAGPAEDLGSFSAPQPRPDGS